MPKRHIFASALWIMAFLFWALPSFAQVDTAWVRRYNGPANSTEWVRAMALDRFGNVYVTGESYGSGTDFDYATVKYYPDGDTAWARRYNDPGDTTDLARAIAVNDSGHVYVTGSSGTIKYDPAGNELWVGLWGGVDIALDTSSNAYVTGGTPDYVTVMYYPNGDTAWVRTYDGGNGPDEACGIAADASGNVYVTGWSKGSGSDYDYEYATIKYYPNGDTAWVRRYDGPLNDWDQAEAIALDNFGNVFVTGWSHGTGTGTDYATIKYDSDGTEVWIKRYDGPESGHDGARAITTDDYGNVYVTGESHGTDWNTDYLTIKYYSDGDTAWVRRYDGPGNGSDYAKAVALDAFKNVYVTGNSVGIMTAIDYATIKYYPNGDTAWTTRYNGAGNPEDYGRAVGVDGSGNIYVTGDSYDSETDRDYVTIKYSSVPQIHVTSPNGGETWTVGDNHDITWIADGFDAVMIEYSTDGGGEWETITANTANDGIQPWIIPNTPSTECRVRASDAADGDPSDMSDGNFTIASPNEPPVVSDIPNQTINQGDIFAQLHLDDFVHDPDNSDEEMIWTHHGDVYLLVFIVDRVASILVPYPEWTGCESIWFKACDPGGLCDSNEASFTVLGADFSIDVFPDTITAFQGDTVEYTVILTSINGFSSPCTLTVIGYPSGTTPDFDPSVVVPTNSSILTIAIPDTTTPDTFTLTITATEMGKIKGIAHSKDVTLVVIGPDFTIEAHPETQFVHAGEDTDYRVVLTSLLGFSSSCTLTATGIPPDGVVSFDPEIIIPTDSSLMTVQTPETTPQGNYDLIITATELSKAKIEHSTQVVLSVSRPDTLWIVAYSPVDLIVTDPVGDSIGLEFNTIQDATYDDTLDWNEDGDMDDLVTIPHPYVGEYQIRVIREEGVDDTATYDLGIRINGSDMDLLADGDTVPPADGCSDYSYDCLAHLKGDVNGDDQINSADVVFLINYLFKSGPAPDPLELGYVNCGDEAINSADVVYLINYLFKGGPPPCS